MPQQQQCLLMEAIKRSYFYQDSELADAILETRDDDDTQRSREIAASSFILSVRSPYFKKILFGSFQESSSKRVNLMESPFGYCTIQSVVHFLYTDEVRKFGDDNNNNNFETSSLSSSLSDKGQQMQMMNDLCDLIYLFNAANYFEIDDLINEVTTIISNLARSFKMKLLLSYSTSKAASINIRAVDDRKKNETKHHIANVAMCLNQISNHQNDIIYNDLQEILILAIELQFSQPTTVDIISPDIILTTLAPHIIERAIPKTKALADSDSSSTTTSTDQSKKKHWLINLDIWSKQSSNHLQAAQHVLKTINTKFLDRDIIEQLSRKGSQLVRNCTM